MALSLRVNLQEERLIREYAKMKNVSVSDLIRQSVMERIEDEIDVQIAQKAYEEYIADPVTYTHDEVKKELGL